MDNTVTTEEREAEELHRVAVNLEIALNPVRTSTLRSERIKIIENWLSTYNAERDRRIKAECLEEVADDYASKAKETKYATRHFHQLTENELRFRAAALRGKDGE